MTAVPSTVATTSTTPPQTISNRAMPLLAGRSQYFTAVVRAHTNLWTETNPDGWLPLAVAENKLVSDLFLQKLATVSSNYPQWVMHYNTPRGTTAFRKTMANLLSTTFLQGHPIEHNALCISSACSGILDNLFYLIADEGQGVFIPAPFYPAFDNDLEARNKLTPVALYLDIEGGDDGDIHRQLDEAASRAADEGHPIAAILITNPNNPLGIVYSEQVVEDMITWCLAHKVHYVSDEVYALSIFKPQTAKFVSAVNIATNLLTAKNNKTTSTSTYITQEDIDAYVHMVYGISKDWGAAGLAVGVLYTRNTQLNKALSCLVSFNSVSNQTQHTLTEIFSDLDWCRSFIAENAAYLEQSYDTLAEALTETGIPFAPAVSGVFLWLDLSRWLPEPTWEAELLLWKKLVYEGNVVLTPGKDCHAEKPGCFRVCYAQVDVGALPVAVQRIKRTVDNFYKSSSGGGDS